MLALRYNACMKLFAILGRPVSHSLSPEMHRAAYRELGIEAEFMRIDCGPDEVPRIAELVRRGVLAGANITLPHKVAALDLADEASEETRLLGAANTWVGAGGRLVAHNTDGIGFLSGLKSPHPNPPPQAGEGAKTGGPQAGEGISAGEGSPNALVLGAGGAARAICLALQCDGWQVKVAARNPEKAAAVFSALGCVLIRWDKSHLEAIAPSLNLVVNSTPIGMEPHEGDKPDFPLRNLPPNAIVYDIVYRPRRTAFLSEAEQLGLTVVDGLEMLVGQGAKAFELWFGIPAPVAAMRKAALECL